MLHDNHGTEACRLSSGHYLMIHFTQTSLFHLLGPCKPLQGSSMLHLGQRLLQWACHYARCACCHWFYGSSGFCLASPWPLPVHQLQVCTDSVAFFQCCSLSLPNLELQWSNWYRHWTHHRQNIFMYKHTSVRLCS